MRNLLLKVGLIVLFAGAVYGIIDKIYGLMYFEETMDTMIAILHETMGEAPSETIELVRNILLTILMVSLACNVIVLLIGVLIAARPSKKKPLGIASILFSLIGLNIISLVGSILILIAKAPEQHGAKPAPVKEEAIVI